VSTPMKTLLETLTAITRRLEVAGVSSPVVDAVWLVSHVMGLSPTRIRLEGKRVLNNAQSQHLEELVVRREAREPLQWILGTVQFYDLELAVQRGVLIPRPETERLVEIVFAELKGMELSTKLSTPPHRVVDIGCGSGAIALSIKARFPQLEVWATDINPAAVALTRDNAQALQFEVNLRETSLLDGIPGKFTAIISNPPYLPETDVLEPEVGQEPREALFSGSDGLSLARAIARLSQDRLQNGGLLALELDARNAATLKNELETLGFTARLEADLAGLRRFVIARL
jgi:release factor glutamine methyltransferase